MRLRGLPEPSPAQQHENTTGHADKKPASTSTYVFGEKVQFKMSNAPKRTANKGKAAVSREAALANKGMPSNEETNQSGTCLHEPPNQHDQQATTTSPSQKQAVDILSSHGRALGADQSARPHMSGVHQHHSTPPHQSYAAASHNYVAADYAHGNNNHGATRGEGQAYGADARHTHHVGSVSPQSYQRGCDVKLPCVVVLDTNCFMHHLDEVGTVRHPTTFMFLCFMVL
jgi:hypothetical protein